MTDNLGPLPEPIAWLAIGGTIWRRKGNHDDEPLYDRATIAAAVAAERERCAKIAESYDTARQNMADVIAEKIRAA